MAQYVDGYVVALPKKNLAAYRRMAIKAPGSCSSPAPSATASTRK